MTYIQTRTPPVRAHDAPAKPLPPHVPYAVRAKRESALRKALDGTACNPNAKHRGGQSVARKAWVADLPEGRVSARAAAAAWVVDVRAAASRLMALVSVNLLARTPPGQRPVFWWRVESPPE